MWSKCSPLSQPLKCNQIRRPLDSGQTMLLPEVRILVKSHPNFRHLNM